MRAVKPMHMAFHCRITGRRWRHSFSRVFNASHSLSFFVCESRKTSNSVYRRSTKVCSFKKKRKMMTYAKNVRGQTVGKRLLLDLLL